MAEENKEEEKSGSKSSFLMSVIVSSVLAFVFGGLGYLTVSFLSGSSDPDEPVAETAEDLKPAFIDFEEVVVNVQDGRMTRFLRLNPTLQVASGSMEDVTAEVESQKAILRNWMISYLSDLTLDELKGSVAQNRIRRDIHNYFNDVLAPDGTELIQDVLIGNYQLQ